MNFVVLGRDQAGGARRRRHRAAHLDHVANRQYEIAYAGASPRRDRRDDRLDVRPRRRRRRR